MTRAALTLFLALFATVAGAHFGPVGQARMIVLDRASGELFLRIPAPLVFAAELAARETISGPVRAEFIEAVEVNGRWAHRLDTAAIAARPEAFMAKVAAGYRLSATPRCRRSPSPWRCIG